MVGPTKRTPQADSNGHLRPINWPPSDPAPFIPLTISKRDKIVDYEAKAVTLAGRRYIVCRNHEQAKKDFEDRASILAALSRQLKKGDKALIGNSGYRRFLRATGEDRFAIDEAKAEEDAKFDGIFVLRTNTDLAPLDAMLCYKQLWTVDIDQTWRLSRFFGVVGLGKRRRQATPRGGHHPNGLQGFDRGGIGMHQFVAAGARRHNAAA